MPRMSKVIMIYNSNAIGQNLKGGRSVKSILYSYWNLITLSYINLIKLSGHNSH